MITFFISILVLLLGYFFYSGFMERIEGINPDRQTPAFKLRDYVDYVPMPWWRVFLIQFLNIAGLGPISEFHATQSPLLARYTSINARISALWCIILITSSNHQNLILFL